MSSSATCRDPGCDHSARISGFCNRHYRLLKAKKHQPKSQRGRGTTSVQDEDIALMRKLRAQFKTYEEIANITGYSYRTVRRHLS